MGHDTQACGDKDPAHDWEAMVTQFNGGKCDGFLKTQTTGDHFPIGYYEEAQVPILGALRDELHAVRQLLLLADGGDVAEPLLPTLRRDRRRRHRVSSLRRSGAVRRSWRSPIFDRVHGAGLTSGYYHWGEPMTGLFESRRYDAITYPIEKFYAEAKAGTLPNVTFVDPDYGTVSEFLGTSNDYHPHGNIQVGEGYVAQVYDALRKSPQWERMVFVVNFDENGGFYDHVAPPTVKDDNVNPEPGTASRLHAARVPGAVHRDGAVRSEEDRDRRPLRALFDPEDDRVAMGPRAHDGARRRTPRTWPRRSTSEPDAPRRPACVRAAAEHAVPESDHRTRLRAPARHATGIPLNRASWRTMKHLHVFDTGDPVAVVA